MDAPTFDARKVRKLRLSLGETQEQFAKRFGVARTLVCHWENMKRAPIGPAAILLRQLAEEAKTGRK